MHVHGFTRPALALTLLLVSSAEARQATQTAVNRSTSHTVLGPGDWSTSGNLGTNPSLHFLGTIDAVPLSFRAANQRAMRYEFVSDGTFESINVLGGSSINQIAPALIGVTIAGGGQDFLFGADYPNEARDSFGTIGGGAGNLVDGYAATISTLCPWPFLTLHRTSPAKARISIVRCR